MRKLEFVVIMVFLLFPILALAEPSVVVCNSEVQIDQPVAAGQMVTGTFAICNHGDSTLNIIQVAPGCGCTVPVFDRTIPPGGRGEIVLNLNTSGYYGTIRKSALVETDDPTHQKFMIKMECIVE